ANPLPQFVVPPSPPSRGAVWALALTLRSSQVQRLRRGDRWTRRQRRRFPLLAFELVLLAFERRALGLPACDVQLLLRLRLTAVAPQKACRKEARRDGRAKEQERLLAPEGLHLGEELPRPLALHGLRRAIAKTSHLPHGVGEGAVILLELMGGDLERVTQMAQLLGDHALSRRDLGVEALLRLGGELMPLALRRVLGGFSATPNVGKRAFQLLRVFLFHPLIPLRIVTRRCDGWWSP